ncbi:MAG: hypothetical protein HY900_27570 [Deltaproteobacteria bacterium]|nr:hypothetical protein [Deltaproteobacteria bacterium]
MSAKLVLRDKIIAGDLVIERTVWQLPEPTSDRPQGLKYSLYCGKKGTCLVRYDNESGKGDHVHYGADEKPYRFTTLTQLLLDFAHDVRRYAG